MSRTRHHRNQKTQRSGYDYGARYSINKGYGGGYGPHPKAMANSQRRAEDKSKSLEY